MIIPKHLMWDPNMTEEKRRRLEKFVKEERKKMKDAPVYESEDEATRVAVDALRREPDMMPPTVWKEPKDMGRKYALVKMELRESAGNGGYTETVDAQKIFDLKKGDIDEIEEL